jgi:sortase family protein
MSRRGSAQLLLLFFRSRARLGWMTGVVVGVLVVAGLLQPGDDFPFLSRTGLAQIIRQSAWHHALAGIPEQAAWPWADTSTAPDATVPRLGLSAVVGKETATVIAPSQPAGDDGKEPRTKLSEVGVGDRITVTTNDGSSRVYRVTGRKVVDPHLADTESGPLGADPTLVTCLPLDPLLASSLRLVIQATRAEPPAPPEPRPEQKL